MMSEREENRMTLDKRINVVSLANLAALVGLIATAFATWYGMVGRVDLLSIKLETAIAEQIRMRTEVQESLRSRDADLRDLRVKAEVTANRLSVVETQIGVVNGTLNRMEQRSIPAANGSGRAP